MARKISENNSYRKIDLALFNEIELVANVAMSICVGFEKVCLCKDKNTALIYFA